MANTREKTVPVMVRIPETLLKKVDTHAQRDDRSRAYVVVDALKRRFAVRGVEKGGAA
jgi:predicted transcriptional regulator